MPDLDQQTFPADQQPQAVRPRTPAVPIDSYTLLLIAGLIVLIVTLGCLVLRHLDYYGLPTFAKPVVGAVSDVSVQNQTAEMAKGRTLVFSPAKAKL